MGEQVNSHRVWQYKYSLYLLCEILGHDAALLLLLLVFACRQTIGSREGGTWIESSLVMIGSVIGTMSLK